MFLATTALADFWDTRGKVLFLGRWCQRHDRQADWKKVQGEILEDPWADRRQVVQAFQYCTNVFEHALGELTAYLNDIHGVSHRPRYWRVILGPWLLEYIQILYDRYVRVHAALRRDPDISTICLDPQCFVTPRNLTDFGLWHTDDAYNLQLCSQLIRLMGLNMPNKCWEADLAPKFPETDFRNTGLGLNVRKWANRLTALFLPSIVIANMNMSMGALSEIMWKSRFSIWPLITDPSMPEGVVADTQIRRGFSTLVGPDQFGSIVMKTLAVNLPILYLEGYKHFRERCLAGWRGVPKVALSENGWYTNESFKFCAAEWADVGTRLLGNQHGGAYGTSRLVPMEWHERAVTDRFFTWGWADPSNEHLGNLPHPRFHILSKAARSFNGAREGILLVSSIFQRYPHRFHAQPIGDQVEEYLDEKITFLDSLPPELRTQITVRLHDLDYGWDARERLISSCPGVKVNDGNVPFLNQLASCRLVVFDYPGTTYLEGLVFNAPCILFWNPSRWEERASAAADFDRLRRALILHDDAKAAASHAGGIYENPWHWWGSEEVQAARRQFVARHAISNEAWASLWIKTLRAEAMSTQKKSE